MKIYDNKWHIHKDRVHSAVIQLNDGRSQEEDRIIQMCVPLQRLRWTSAVEIQWDSYTNYIL